MTTPHTALVVMSGCCQRTPASTMVLKCETLRPYSPALVEQERCRRASTSVLSQSATV